MKKKLLLFGAVAVTAVAVACGEKAATPVSPSPAVSSDTAAASADGSTLKATAPAPQQPVNGSTVSSISPNLVIANSTLKYLGDVSLTASIRYKVNVETPAGAQVYAGWATPFSGTDVSAHRIPAGVLLIDTIYRWRARAEIGSSFGPWSAYWTFATPKAGGASASYQTATELWDNLTDGKTIGRPTNMEFTVGKGARTVDFSSFIQYPLQQTLTAGEMSFYVDNFNPLAAGGKTKFASMSSDAADVTTDPWRFTLEKRGSSYVTPGQVRWRIITGSATSAVNDGGPWQPVLDKTKTHFIRFTWGANRVTLLIAEADPTTGALGTVRLSVSAGYTGTYRPSPHMAYIGVEPGRAGIEDASVPNMTVRYVWISDGNTPRPPYTPPS